ncbi:MAG TPA: META domain-containing protein, partial [Anaerolineae bacterium]|nr:META domain-containing protein [Anaerolineae bacterium]
GDPTLYTVTFRADGTLGVVADCNSGVGTYQASESGALTINLAISHAFCASNSLSNQFISYLEVANSYNVQGDMLTIGFSSNNGTMIFAAAP